MANATSDEYDEHASDFDSGAEDGGVRPGSETASPGSGSKANSSSKPASHLQKRRRVTRACDECRRKKIKCDGKQPCTHCTVYSYDCTYDQPSNRRRNPAPQYVESLEHRVHRAETLLHILFPNLDLSNPGIDAAVAQGWIPGAPGKGEPPLPQQNALEAQTALPAADAKSETNLESMIRAVAQIDLDETGHWGYHGHSSGLSFVRRMREQLGDLMGPNVPSTPFVKAMPVTPVWDSPMSGPDSPMLGEHSGQQTELPEIDLARRMCSHAVNDAASLFRVVHQPTFWASFDRIFTIQPDLYTNKDHVFLPLFYSAMALGSLFGKSEDDREGYETLRAQGFAYFRTARHLMDIADCRDLPHVQAVVFMILFLQSTSKLSQCYAYLGIALRSACRMGLHRSSVGLFDPIESETRKRLFWTIWCLDTYVGSMIGLPNTLRNEDIDQDFPVEVDDEYITREGILPMPEGTVSLMVACNLHTNLVQILVKIVRKIYPIKFQTPLAMGDKAYSVPFSSIRDIESDLEQWKTSLPSILTPSDTVGKYTRVQQYLRLMYAYAQVMLYRPFLHFVTMDKRNQVTDQRAYACAASFVNVSRNIIHIQTAMRQQGLLNGGYWFSMYTTFFSILALVYFAAENPDNPTTHAVMKDAIEGREGLASLASRSMAADRCTATLDIIFSRLPAWMRDGKQNPVLTKKRPYPETSDVPHEGRIPISRSQQDVSFKIPETLGPGSVRRAATFPTGETPTLNGVASPFPGQWSQATSSYGGPQTPSSATFEQTHFPGLGGSAMPGSVAGSLPQFTATQNYGNPALTDLSTMMFPVANEPFVYPNQPLTTFENTQQFGKNSGYAAADANGLMYGPADQTSPRPSQSRGGEDIEAQFHALPPFIQREHMQQQMLAQQQQRQQQQNMSTQQRGAMPYGNGQTMAGGQAMPMLNGQWNGDQGFQPQDMANINIPDIFGNEWSSMNMPAGSYPNPHG